MKGRTVLKEPPLSKRYPTFSDPAETPDAEERYVRRKFAELQGPVTEGIAAAAAMDDDDIDFDLLGDGTAASAKPPADEEYMRGFICYQVYTTLSDVPAGSLPVPRDSIDTPEMCRDTRFAVDASTRAKHFVDTELRPHADRLYAHLEAALAWNKDVTRFHKLLRTKFGYQRSFLTALPAERAHVLLAAHAVYCMAHYVRDAANTVMDRLSDRERTAMQIYPAWVHLCGGDKRRAEQPISKWTCPNGDNAENEFVRRVCYLRDVMRLTQSWLAE